MTMASIRPIKNDDGAVISYEAQHRDGQGKQHRKRFKMRKQAQAYLDHVTASMANGTYCDPTAGKATVAEIIRVWQGNPKWKPTTRMRNQGIATKYIAPRFGAIPVNRISSAQLQEWVNELAATKLAPRTVRKIVDTMSGIMAMAVKHHKIGVNPVRGLDLPAPPLSHRRYLTKEQVEEFAQAAAGWRGLIVRLLACTGLRFGELAALRVRNVNLLKRRIMVEASVSGSGVLHETTPKNHQRRTVPYPPFLDEALAAQCAGKAPEALLFANRNGTYIRNGNMRREWWDEAALASVGPITPHELRHTAASIAISSGATPKVVQRMMGHASAAMTMDVYADLFPDDLDQVAERMAENWPKVERDMSNTAQPLRLVKEA